MVDEQTVRTAACWKKRRYANVRSVKAHILVSMQHNHVKLYYYPCQFCGGYHMTHKYYPGQSHTVGPLTYKRLMKAVRICRKTDRQYYQTD